MAWEKTEAEEAKQAVQASSLKSEQFFTHQKQMPSKRGLRIGAWGDPEAGKSFFGGTCKEPIYWIDTEFAAKALVDEHFPDKDVYIYECSVIDPLSEIEAPDPIKSLQNLENSIIALKGIAVGTIIVDTVSDYWSWMSAYVEANARRFYKKTGDMMRTEWSTGNERYRYFINRLLIKSNKNCDIVLISQPKPIYLEGQDTGMTKPAWQRQTQHWCDVVIWFHKETIPGEGLKYQGTITKCRLKRALNHSIEDLTYDKLRDFMVNTLKVRRKM